MTANSIHVFDSVERSRTPGEPSLNFQESFSFKSRTLCRSRIEMRTRKDRHRLSEQIEMQPERIDIENLRGSTSESHKDWRLPL